MSLQFESNCVVLDLTIKYEIYINRICENRIVANPYMCHCCAKLKIVANACTCHCFVMLKIVAKACMCHCCVKIKIVGNLHVTLLRQD